ncbi:MAG: phosphoribosylformylglycinamidine synthase, partial [Saprospiraceae bacterium]|nr:phosphoribosylformylglycinamidine synthase [Saprospiraceae bacterium]
MIQFFGSLSEKAFAVQTAVSLNPKDIEKLTWLFGDQPLISGDSISGDFIGPRAAMITPWSTNAVEITQNMGISGIDRIERFSAAHDVDESFDPMLDQRYQGLDQQIFDVHVDPQEIKPVHDLAAYDESEGLALSPEEISYLESLSKRIGRPLTDSEVFGFSQVNSEHCRHKIFNGEFVIDGRTMPSSLFSLIKKTAQVQPEGLVSAYKDNVAFIEGPQAVQFAPERGDRPAFYAKESFESVISLKAETHNFPTTVEPFNGAATGSGGEIRDRLAGGRGSIPIAGTALYMTAYPRFGRDRPWEDQISARPWLYQTPIDILIKASNGASDFGNKFGQPLIGGSVLTFEHQEHNRTLGYDKVIMLAGGVGYAKAQQASKDKPQPGDRIVILGGDNYRIGMGGAAVSSADTGAYSSGIELNAVQRSNPEMQKRVANVIRAMVEAGENIITSIHDHGAGGHLNCLSELVEETGGEIDLDKLPIGDPTLSAKEIIGNESQERMGLVVQEKDMQLLQEVAERERSPIYDVGTVTGNKRFVFRSGSSGSSPMNLDLADMFGSSPKTVMQDQSIDRQYAEVIYDVKDVDVYIRQVLRLEAVACKDWLTNKVDRCVGGKVAKQQCVGPLQLPLNDCAVVALDYDGQDGIATSMGHAPLS